MPMGNTAQIDALKLFLCNVTWANLGDVTGLVGSGTAGSCYVALHASSPGAGGNQSTNEAAFTGYARVPIARALASFSFSGSSPTSAANAVVLTFPACTGGSETETYFSVGRDSSGAGEIIVFAPLTISLAVSSGYVVSFAIGQLVVTAT